MKNSCGWLNLQNELLTNQMMEKGRNHSIGTIQSRVLRVFISFSLIQALTVGNMIRSLCHLGWVGGWPMPPMLQWWCTHHDNRINYNCRYILNSACLGAVMVAAWWMWKYWNMFCFNILYASSYWASESSQLKSSQAPHSTSDCNVMSQFYQTWCTTAPECQLLSPCILLRLMNNKEVKPPVLVFGTEQV